MAAAAAKRSGNLGIFWMNGVSDEEQPVVFVPGVDREAKTQTPFSLGPGSTSTSNKRGIRRASAGKTQTTQLTGDKNQGHFGSGHSHAYTKGKVSVPTEDSLSPPSGTSLPLTQVNQVTFDASKAKSEVCLKDLCPEDKRRIANLIEELARVSEEKEQSVQRLKDEQGNFERKIQHLEQQNLVIAEERESLQQQYKECQELLGLYQQYLSQQQAKLNQSIAQLSQPLIRSKVLSSEEAPSRTSTSRANGSLFDGSYLGLAATGAQQPNIYRSGDGIRGGVQMLLNPSCDSESCLTEAVVKQGQKRPCRKPKSCHRCHDTGCETQQWRSDCGPCLGDGHHYPFNEEECESTSYSGNVMVSEATAALTRPLLGHEDWEEKRHQLLLQKMQLEMEREKLQARLAEQEERLNRQNQQLRQSCLDYTRFQQASQTEFSSSHSRNGSTEPECLSHQKLPSSVYEAAGQSLHEKHSQTVTALLDNGSEQSRRDEASAQAKSAVSQSQPTSLLVIQDIPDSRLDFSVAELLDVFSPVTAPEQCKPPAQRPKTSQHKSAFNASKSLSRTLLTPSGLVPQSTQQDPEESQILEDIFFIC
ncbi:protein hinderin isoform X2 [Parambassis ranga]|uniref:Protein hinderin isoform X2 n=1 Tax=Parambassis ranga TaxID=210632 RepID=A0A6P7IIY8_9TELE|nr:protein hinderin isoform X2 [Parambassis ranga]